MKKEFSKTYLMALLLSVSLSSNAADFVLEAGLHAGGDDLVTATFVSGSTQTIEAGGLYNFALGVGFDINEKVTSRITFGIKQDSITASNGNIEFTRYPLDALVFYKTDSWLFGGGITYHTNVKLSGDGLASGLSANFDDSMGFILEADYLFGNKKGYVGGRYTMIDYDTVPSATVNAATVDGNSIGVVVGYRF